MAIYCLADKFHHVKGFKMLCVRGHLSDIPDIINLDEKLENVSKLPPNVVHYDKSFTGMCIITVLYS